MGKEKAELTREFHVIADFDRFHKGEKVEGVIYPDYVAIEGREGELDVPYSDVQYVAHCERPEGRMAGMATGVPFIFGQKGLGSLLVETAASIGISGAEWGAAPNLMQNLCLIGYYSGSEECWILLQDTHTFETNAFVQSVAKRAHTKVIHYFSALQRKTQ